ncbi:MAG: hypothetical protein FWE41_04630 [Coriobacteriia bacterium]|nr:hypothetical protein [Coriobacteriia bacterium]MCL2749770.1 hypothetical protein [Coriobacteriia bacterium]
MAPKVFLIFSNKSLLAVAIFAATLLSFAGCQAPAEQGVSSISAAEEVSWTRDIDDVPFVNDEYFEIIREAYSSIDFSLEFLKGDEELRGFYKENYLRLLSCEVTLIDKDTQEEFYLNEFGFMDFTKGWEQPIYGGSADTYDPANYLYYFYDIDGDGSQEICISDGTRFVYVFKYDCDLDRFFLWHELGPSWFSLFGTKKLLYYRPRGPEGNYGLQLLNQEGVVELNVSFKRLSPRFENDHFKFSIMLPEYTDESIIVSLPESMIEMAYIKTLTGNYFFKVTEAQWDELTGEFFMSLEQSKDNLKEVTFTFEELFGIA